MQVCLSLAPNQTLGCGLVPLPLCQDFPRPRAPRTSVASVACLSCEAIPILSQEKSIPVNRQPGLNCLVLQILPVSRHCGHSLVCSVQRVQSPLDFCGEHGCGSRGTEHQSSLPRQKLQWGPFLCPWSQIQTSQQPCLSLSTTQSPSIPRRTTNE